MKRKRGNKKGKSKKSLLADANKAVQTVSSGNVEDDSGLNEFDNEEVDPGMEAETPSSQGTGTDQPERFASINSVGLADKTDKKIVYGRVKVKIKTTKNFESQHTSSEATTHSDTDKGSQQVGLEKQGVAVEKTEDSANSLPEGVLVNLSRKTGGIKIKSSSGFNTPSINPCSNSEQVRGDRIDHKEPELVHRSSGYNEQELNASLEVIAKVMKMDAAEPFNVPVNPIELGIPDYFDVIDTPMDFGTIRSNLENGKKYINSEDVYKDVQYIWDNCYKYNNKGDYILELMKRVKKNFTKCWAAAGLYTEQYQSINGVEDKDGAHFSQGKISVKGDQSKNKTKRRPGIKWHKDDCLCAICVMMRRKHEREETVQIVEDHLEKIDDHHSQEVKLEEISPVESLSEDTSSNMDNAPDPDGDADIDSGEREEVKLQPRNENEMNSNVEYSEHLEFGDKLEDARNHQLPPLESSCNVQNDTRKEQLPPRQEIDTSVIEQQKHKELRAKVRAEVYENIRRSENPMLVRLSEALFVDNRKSVWNGPHSLSNNHQRSSAHNNSICSAIASFFK